MNARISRGCKRQLVWTAWTMTIDEVEIAYINYRFLKGFSVSHSNLWVSQFLDRINLVVRDDVMIDENKRFERDLFHFDWLEEEERVVTFAVSAS